MLTQEERAFLANTEMSCGFSAKLLEQRRFIAQQNRENAWLRSQLKEDGVLQEKIEQQAQEIARLTKDRDEWESAAKLNNGTYERQQRTIQALREALRNLLEENKDYIKINNLAAMGNVNIVEAQRVLEETR